MCRSHIIFNIFTYIPAQSSEHKIYLKWVNITQIDNCMLYFNNKNEHIILQIFTTQLIDP